MEQNLSLLLTLQLQHTQSQKKRLFSTTLRKIKEKEIIKSFHTNVPKYSSKCRFRSVIGRLIESSTIVEEGNLKIYCLCLSHIVQIMTMDGQKILLLSTRATLTIDLRAFF